MWKALQYEYDKNHDAGWTLEGATTQDCFGVAVAQGSLIWSHSDGEFQLKGEFQLEWRQDTDQYRVIAVGDEVDNGPILTTRIFLPTGGWRRHKKNHTSKNTIGTGIGYIIKFPQPNDCNITRMQFVFPSHHQHFDLALDRAFEKNRLSI